MANTTLSQKEYLIKKYLGGGDKKKRIKKHKIKNQNVQIIDDDINLENIRPIDDVEFNIMDAREDLPNIVGVIDERGPVDFGDRRRWKMIAGDKNVAVSSDQNFLDLSPSRASETLTQDMRFEITKPLARYADDPDLDAELRAVIHEFEDPIRLFTRNQQSKTSYENSSMSNRFCIKPGHRWDGVDRSNGYEKKWIEAKNARDAVQEEAYKWSTSDM